MLRPLILSRKACFLLVGTALLVCTSPVELLRADGNGPVSFSVNGPADPQYDGLPMPGGLGVFNQPWSPPPPPGLGPYPPIRLNIVPMAEGIPTFRIGDVNDYFISGTRSEGEIFQSEPDLNPAGPPGGTNNQILQAAALGLMTHYNVNALTFGEDYFNGDETPVLGGEIPWDDYWAHRNLFGGFVEPVVAPGGNPITFYFSVDPWAIGLAGTAVQSEATLAGGLTLPAGPPGSADEYLPGGGPPYSIGPWTSDGEAAGDVFDADPVVLLGVNNLDHDESSMGLLAPRNVANNEMEDDLDALEHVGANTVGGGPAEPGNTHDRVDPTVGINGGIHPPDLGDPFNPNHDPNQGNPIIFSVDRGTYGAPGSAVEAQVNAPGEGASGDLFVAVTIFDPLFGGLVTTNMLLIDEGQLGLMPHDDLDAVIVHLLIGTAELQNRIDLAASNFNTLLGSTGDGFTVPLLNNQLQSEAAVGFSVDTSSIGLLFSAVDFECRVDGLGLVGTGYTGSGIMEQSGDIFYADLMPPPGQGSADTGTGLLFGQNYLWFEENTIGLDPGVWSFIGPGPIPPSDLADLPDELNALDSLQTPVGLPCDPDFDNDGDVDLADYTTFALCYNGTLNPVPPGCNPDVDLDADGDADGADFMMFSNCFNDALNPPRPQCCNPIPMADFGTVTIDIKSNGLDARTFTVGQVPATIPIEIYMTATTGGWGGLNNGVQTVYVDLTGSAITGVMQSALTLDSTFHDPYHPPLQNDLGFDVFTSGGTGYPGGLAEIGGAQAQPAGPLMGDMDGVGTTAAPHPNGQPPVLIATGTLNLANLLVGTHTVDTAGSANLWEPPAPGYALASWIVDDSLPILVLFDSSCNPDLDFDGDVDGSDFLTFSNCYNGSINPPRPICANTEADINGDGSVDGNDFLTFSNCYNGSLNPPPPPPDCVCNN